jgi:hypothetical protein
MLIDVVSLVGICMFKVFVSFGGFPIVCSNIDSSQHISVIAAVNLIHHNKPTADFPGSLV